MSHDADRMREHGFTHAVMTVLAALAVALSPGSLASTVDGQSALELSQAAVGRSLQNHTLAGANGRSLAMKSLHDKPLVVNLVFTSCYGSCSIITRRLAAAVDVARDALGSQSFRVVTIGFDSANDTPDRMRAYARKQGVGDDSWLVAGLDAATAEALTHDLGFSYAASPRGFDHVSQVSIIDRSGRVYRQIYGDAFPTPALVEPLKELVWGTTSRESSLGGWLDGLKLLCTVYDPASDRYRFDYSVFVAAITGILCLGSIVVFVVRSWNAGHDRHAR